MTISITEDIMSVSDLKKNTNRIFQQIHNTGRPVIITVNGKPDIVMIDVDDFENKIKALNLSQLLAPAEKDIKEGRVRSARLFLREFRKNEKIWSQNYCNRRTRY